MYKIKVLLLYALVSTLSHKSAAAIHNGPMANRSEVTVDVNFSVSGDGTAGSILVGRLNKITFGTLTGSESQSSLNRTEPFCVYRVGNPDGFNFSLIVNSKNSDGKFELFKDGVSSPTIGQKVEYTVHFTSSGNTSPTSSTVFTHIINENVIAFVKAIDGVGLENRTTCSGDNVALIVAPKISDILNAESGQYSDELTLTVSPR